MKRAWALAAAMFAGAAFAGWDYETDQDKMTGKKTVMATMASTNSLALDFPYKGENHGHLMVRQHPQYGLGVVFSVDKGQILCRLSECEISVRFDESPPMKFSADPPADHSSNHVFLRDRTRFINAAKKAKKILIQVTMHTNGAPILEFATAPLVWPPKQ
jgi:hypothetical protein